MANGLTAFFTLVIAAATIVYVFFTRRLWQETKKSADAAASSAEAAKQSAEITAALHRPYIAFQSRSIPDLSSSSQWLVPIELRNYGTLPATHLSASFEFHTESAQESRFPVQLIRAAASIEISPQSAYEATLRPALADTTQTQVNSSRQVLILTLKATYSAQDDRRFEYTAEASLDTATRRFELLKSETRAV